MTMDRSRSRQDMIARAVEEIRAARRIAAFTGAGISVESGIPPFRGPGGLWSKYDPHILDINYFYMFPETAWVKIKEIFYDFFAQAQPNAAHHALVRLEQAGKLKCVITQNIDNLHQQAGSTEVIEFHGNSKRLVCLKCGQRFSATPEIFNHLPPRCVSCGKILKPDFVFFGEPIPIDAHERALAETELADLWLVIGTTGEVYPAASVPITAKYNGKRIIEVNLRPSEFTHTITDIFLQGKAGEVMQQIVQLLFSEGQSG